MNEQLTLFDYYFYKDEFVYWSDWQRLWSRLWVKGIHVVVAQKSAKSAKTTKFSAVKLSWYTVT